MQMERKNSLDRTARAAASGERQADAGGAGGRLPVPQRGGSGGTDPSSASWADSVTRCRRRGSEPPVQTRVLEHGSESADPAARSGERPQGHVCLGNGFEIRTEQQHVRDRDVLRGRKLLGKRPENRCELAG